MPKKATTRRQAIVILVSAAVGGAGLFAACTDSYRGGASGGTGTGPGGTGSGGGGANDSSSSFQTDGGTCDPDCSNDLRKVIDCKGRVQETCPPEQACSNAKCIDDPCQAAEQSQSSYGCDYWALKPAQRREASGACFAAFVANTWPKAVHLQVERGGATLPVEDFAYIPKVQGQNVDLVPYDPAPDKGLGIGEVAILFLSRSFGGLIACPKDPAVADETGVVGTGRGEAFRIKSDYPVVVYQIAPYGGGQTSYTSATLLLPTSAWDKNYMAVNAYRSFPETPAESAGQPSLAIVARENGTEVSLLPKVNIVGGTGVPGATQGTTVKYTLNEGEYLQIVQDEELSGSPIESDKPIGVIGGSTCMRVPVAQRDCDSAHQQIAPVHATGNEYVAVRHADRTGANDESPPWRLVGMLPNTQLTWEPSKPEGAPDTLAAGEVKEFNSPGPFVVRSQDSDHPFYLGSYMTGGVPYGGVGDPEWVNVIPPQQYRDNYVFFTDPTYPETSLVVVRTPSKVDKTFAPVTLDCLGELDGWEKVGDYEYTRVQLVSGNFVGNGSCQNGGNVMKSDLPFGITVWGWGTTAQTRQVSYAYPAAAGFKPINNASVNVPD